MQMDGRRDSFIMVHNLCRALITVRCGPKALRFFLKEAVKCASLNQSTHSIHLQCSQKAKKAQSFFLTQRQNLRVINVSRCKGRCSHAPCYHESRIVHDVTVVASLILSWMNTGRCEKRDFANGPFNSDTINESRESVFARHLETDEAPSDVCCCIYCSCSLLPCLVAVSWLCANTS